MTEPIEITDKQMEARVPDGVGIDMPGPEGGWAVAVIDGRVYRARVAAARVPLAEVYDDSPYAPRECKETP